MWTPSDRFQRFFGKRSPQAVAILLLVLGFAFTGAAYAAPAPQSTDRPPATAQEKSDLRRALESRYEVLPVSGGVLLKPRQAKAGIRTIEVTGGQIAVNGERVSARILRDWLGADADAVIRLQGLSAADQRQLLGLGEETTATPPASTQETSEEAATSDTDVAETDSSVQAPEPPEVPERPEVPEPPETPRSAGRHTSGSRVNVGGSVTVRRGEAADDAVAVGGSVEVAGEVSHDVTAIGGPVRVEGRVGGDVISIGGSVYLGPHAVVEGDVTSVGGRIEEDPGSAIHGGKSQVGMFPFLRHHRGFRTGPFWGGPWGFWGGVSDLLGSLMSLILTGLLVCLVVLVARRPLERVDRQLAAQPWRAALVGLAGSIFFWPLLIVVTILLAITIVGCVLFLLYPFLLLYVGLLLLLGYAAAAYRLGRWLEFRFNRSFGGPYAAALVGVVALQGWHVLGNLLDILPGPLGFFGFVTSLFGAMITTAALVIGFGAVLLARLGLEPGYWPRRGAPMPPVPPTSPVEQLPLTDPLTSPPVEPRWEGREEPGIYPQEPPR
jgi:hypothetical protein